MGKNNICVIYDSDENYAKRLMSIINDDNEIPYNAQVFTKEKELDSYLHEKKADVLMISEEAYAYDAGRTGSKTVVLCEEDDDAQEINSREKEELIGVCKYQPSYQLLHTVMRYDRKDIIKRSGMLKVIGVYGFNNTKRILLSLALARVLSESGNTLFISFEVFSCLGNILKSESTENLSDALYAFRQNHNQFHKNIVNAINHCDRLDYIPEADCAEDIADIKPEEICTFVQGIGREMGYSYIVIDIGDCIRMPWDVLGCCDKCYMTLGDDYIENCRIKNLEKYMIEQGMDNIVQSINKVQVELNVDITLDDLWGKLPFNDFYEELKSTLNPGEE